MVVAPLVVPPVDVSGLRDDGHADAVEPDLTKGGRRRDAVNHGEDAHHGQRSASPPVVVVGAIQVEGTVGSVELLPVDVVELQLVQAGKVHSTGFVGGACLCLRVLLRLLPVVKRQVGLLLLKLIQLLDLTERRRVVDVRGNVKVL